MQNRASGGFSFPRAEQRLATLPVTIAGSKMLTSVTTSQMDACRSHNDSQQFLLYTFSFCRPTLLIRNVR
jgi:hypothetical protein